MAANIHTTSANAVMLVRGSLRLAPIINEAEALMFTGFCRVLKPHTYSSLHYTFFMISIEMKLLWGGMV